MLERSNSSQQEVLERFKVADSIYARKLGPKWVHGAPKRPVTDPQTAWLTSPWAQLAGTDPLAGWGDKKFSAGNS